MRVGRQRYRRVQPAFFDVREMEAPDDVLPYTVDSTGRIVAGRNLLNDLPIPGPVMKSRIGQSPDEWNGASAYGNSNNAGRRPVLTSVSPTTPVGISIWTGDLGPRTLELSTTAVPLFENDYSISMNPVLGESILTTGLQSMIADCEAINGIDPANNAWIAGVSAVGGSDIDDQIDRPQSWFRRKLIAQYIKQKEFADAAGKSFIVRFTDMVAGGKDAAASLPSADWKSVFTTGYVEAADRRVREVTGQKEPVFTFVTHYPRGVSVSDGIHRALYELTQEHPLVWYTFNGQALATEDDRHWTGQMLQVVAHYKKRAWRWKLYDGIEPKHLKVLEARYRHDTGKFHITYDPPTLPVALDISAIGAATQYGAATKDGDVEAGLIGLSDFEVVGGDTLVFTPTRAPNGRWVYRTGLDFDGVPAAKPLIEAYWHNIRDSTDDPVYVDGSWYPTWHWAPAAQWNGVSS